MGDRLTIADLPPPPPGRIGWPWTESPGSGAASPINAGPRVSVVTPSFNQAAYIEETIRSVLLQGYPDLEYIVLDGGSTDGTVEIIRRYASWLARWTSRPDGGQTEAINRGWRQASGSVLAWLNSDDVYLPDAVAMAAGAFIGRPEAGMVYGSADVVDGEGRQLRVWTAKTFSVAAMLGAGNVVPQAASFYARGALEEVGFLRERWSMIMDFDLSLRVGMRYPHVCLPKTIARFRDHSASKSRTNFASIANELFELIEELDGEMGADDQWSATKRRALARIRYEWAMSCLVGAGDPAAGLRNLRQSLRLDPTYQFGRPVPTAALLKGLLVATLRHRLGPG